MAKVMAKVMVEVLAVEVLAVAAMAKVIELLSVAAVLVIAMEVAVATFGEIRTVTAAALSVPMPNARLYLYYSLCHQPRGQRLPVEGQPGTKLRRPPL